MISNYVPAAGDLIWIHFDPQAGREQGGRRPALVLSLESYNRKSELVVCCPITSRQKGYPFEVALPPASAESGGVTGIVLADQVRSVDWRVRRAERAGTATAELVEEVKLVIAVLLQMQD